MLILDADFLTPPSEVNYDAIHSSDDDEVALPKKRGSKIGSKRGKYHKKASESAKRRVIEAANEQRDWRVLAEALGVKIPTARSWIKKGTPTMKPTGGMRNVKIMEYHLDSIREWIEENVSISLREITEKLNNRYNLTVCTSTIDNHFEGMLFTVKKVHRETETANNDINKQKR